MFYGQAGGKDLLKRKWKDLAEFVTLECDGKDMTSKLKDHKVHAIVFLNIPRYWNLRIQSLDLFHVKIKSSGIFLIIKSLSCPQAVSKPV
jgi:hypothetical protein